MNLKNIIVLLTGLTALLLLSCNDDEFGPRKESTPVIVSAGVSPSSLTFGDSITLSAKITDPATNLSTLAYEVVSEKRVLATGEIPIKGDSHEVTQAIFVPLLDKQVDQSDVQVNLIARNVLKGTTSHQITGLTGSRPLYQQLYLVTDNGNIVVLEPQAADKNKFRAENLTFDTSVRFKIAEKINDDKSIDYSGDVYGNINGRIGMINESGESAFVYAPGAEYTKELTFDLFEFTVTPGGSDLAEDDLALKNFEAQEISGESFQVLHRTLTNGESYPVFGQLADAQMIFNPDFFERTATDKVTFLGKTGEYAIYYNPIRKNIFVGVDNPSYPDYLLACGWGLGYPTLVSSEQIASTYPGRGRTHTDWNFDNVMNYLLLRQTAEGVYQGTFYTPSDHDHYASFKPFENSGWGNEKKAGDFTFTGEQIIKGTDNWDIPNGEDDPSIESTNYRFTINLNDNTVHIEKVAL